MIIIIICTYLYENVQENDNNRKKLSLDCKQIITWPQELSSPVSIRPHAMHDLFIQGLQTVIHGLYLKKALYDRIY